MGGYDVGEAPVGAICTWNDLVNSNYWSLNLVAVNLGPHAITLSTNIAIVDSGTSYILMPY